MPPVTPHDALDRADDPTTHLRRDGTVFPPVTPDPPAPPGYRYPLDDSPVLRDLSRRGETR
ncbi:MAG: hypothetical protein M3171_08140 [Actinomycetota bacterium]|nr:hypothetical protein [Actinomycetota bacterium]